MYRVGLKDEELIIEKSQEDGTGNGRKVWVPVEDKTVAKNVVTSVKRRLISNDGYRYPSLWNGFFLDILVVLDNHQKKSKKLAPKDDKITDAIRAYLNQDGV